MLDIAVDITCFIPLQNSITQKNRMQGQERNALVVKKKKKKWKKELLGHLRGAFCYRARNARIASRSSQLRRFEREKERERELPFFL